MMKEHNNSVLKKEDKLKKFFCTLCSVMNFTKNISNEVVKRIR
jgi:hypothetical protein